jgi:hypothetical protein
MIPSKPDHMITNTIRARRLPRNRDLLRIAAKRRNILLYPAQREPLVEEPDIRLAGFDDFARCEEAPARDAVVE